MSKKSKKIEALLKLSGPERYRHFVKVIADREEAWALYRDGWALAATEDGQPVFPFWPEEEFAALCAVKDWKGYTPESIPLQDLLEQLLPNLKADNVLPGVFYTPSNKGVTPTVDGLIADIETELENYS
ncbi:DUF2750 domain-containing protein [Labrenzia sp. PHM005]|uniref:DUF2750 domain-containing protein n=1 Tax=Labrenzia sp. PHM005 TaxID=2590016 RepID=UPI001140182C|nr:DUF2750 domain-containing protein [Labrenzia sp. PHM005]QDG74411.1 DUF2750 domain-containing protein [Labrenzia sp. PHM005]